jgi:MFS family permease
LRRPDRALAITRDVPDHQHATPYGVFTAAMLAFMAIGSTLPILPRYVHGPLGAGDLSVGVVTGAFAVTAIVCRPFAGRAADARGRRPLFMLGAALAVVAGLLYYLPLDVPGLILARFVLGAGEGMVFTAGAAWTVDLADPERHGRSIGLFGLAIWVALSVGPVIGEALRSIAGYDAVWAFAAAAPAFALLVARTQPERHTPVPPAAGRESLLPAAAVRPGIGLALAGIGFATLSSFVVLHLDKDATGHGTVAFIAFAFAVVVMRTVAGRLPDVIGGRRSAIAAGIAETIGLALIAAATTLPVALAGAVVMGAGFSVLFPSFALVVVSEADDQRRGAALGAFSAFFDLGVGAGGLIAGGVAAAAGYPAAFWVGSACALCGVLVTTLGAHRAGELAFDRAPA